MVEAECRPYKFVLLGSSQSGKTCIVQRVTQDFYTEDNNHTIGADYAEKDMLIQDKAYRVQIWDTAGQERYRSLAALYLRGAHACLFVYDCSNPDALGSLEPFIANARHHLDPSALLIVIASKVDVIDKKSIFIQVRNSQETMELYLCKLVQNLVKE